MLIRNFHRNYFEYLFQDFAQKISKNLGASIHLHRPRVHDADNSPSRRSVTQSVSAARGVTSFCRTPSFFLPSLPPLNPVGAARRGARVLQLQNTVIYFSEACRLDFRISRTYLFFFFLLLAALARGKTKTQLC